MTLFLLVLLVVSGLSNFLCTVLILRELAKAGIRIGYFELRWQVHKHLKAYRQLTRERTGRVGPAYYGYLGTLAGLIVSALLLFSPLAR